MEGRVGWLGTSHDVLGILDMPKLSQLITL